jgi:tyrosyl-tRNA synthetase
VLSLMVKCGLCKSNGEARRLVQQGGVFVADEKVQDASAAVSVEQLQAGVVIRKGKKVFHKAILKG